MRYAEKHEVDAQSRAEGWQTHGRHHAARSPMPVTDALCCTLRTGGWSCSSCWSQSCLKHGVLHLARWSCALAVLRPCWLWMAVGSFRRRMHCCVCKRSHCMLTPSGLVHVPRIRSRAGIAKLGARCASQPPWQAPGSCCTQAGKQASRLVGIVVWTLSLPLLRRCSCCFWRCCCCCCCQL